MKTNNDNTQAASVAQSDSRPTGDQEVAGSIPAGSGNIEIDHDTFCYGHSLPSADSRRAVVRCAQILFNRVEN